MSIGPEDQGIRVTVTDLNTGDTETTVIWDDYCLITAGTCRQSSVDVHANGTHVITVKGRRRR